MEISTINNVQKCWYGYLELIRRYAQVKFLMSHGKESVVNKRGIRNLDTGCLFKPLPTDSIWILLLLRLFYFLFALPKCKL